MRGEAEHLQQVFSFMLPWGALSPVAGLTGTVLLYFFSPFHFLSTAREQSKGLGLGGPCGCPLPICSHSSLRSLFSHSGLLRVPLSLGQFPGQGLPPCGCACLEGSSQGGCRARTLAAGLCSDIRAEFSSDARRNDPAALSAAAPALCFFIACVVVPSFCVSFCTAV